MKRITMTHCEELHKLLTEEVIHEVGNVVKQMEGYAAENELTPEMEEEQAGIRAIRDNFLNIIQAIEMKQIEEGNCEELLKELSMMRQMGADTPL